jgi:hypothetical protein
MDEEHSTPFIGGHFSIEEVDQLLGIPPITQEKGLVQKTQVEIIRDPARLAEIIDNTTTHYLGGVINTTKAIGDLMSRIDLSPEQQKKIAAGLKSNADTLSRLQETLAKATRNTTQSIPIPIQIVRGMGAKETKLIPILELVPLEDKEEQS